MGRRAYAELSPRVSHIQVFAQEWAKTWPSRSTWQTTGNLCPPLCQSLVENDDVDREEDVIDRPA